MSSLRKLERDFVAADLAAVQAMLERLTDEDVVMRFNLEERRDELRRRLDELGQEDEPTASAALFFSGRPVIGGVGIESEFAGEAISKFQDLVSKQFAHDRGGLGQRGTVPNKAATRLHITNVVRGSFGFLVQEIDPQVPMLESSLKAAVDKVVDTLTTFGDEDEERFVSAIDALDERLLDSMKGFFSFMSEGGATLRVVAGRTDHTFDNAAIERARERADITTVQEALTEITGVLIGVLPESHMFEFRCDDGRGVIKGKVDEAISTERLLAFSRQWVDKPSIAKLTVREVRKRDQVARQSYVLHEIVEPDEPEVEFVRW